MRPSTPPRTGAAGDLYAVEAAQDATPVPCLHCAVLVEHDCAPLVFIYLTPQVSGAVCDGCMAKVPVVVRHFYTATLVGNITLAEQVTRLMTGPGGEPSELEMSVEEAMARGVRTDEVRQALARREAAQRAAAVFLIPAQRL
ncbi:hypothetical protein [Streptomyces sp. NPDC091383]|uniref:hypothetical protein n=1 Tax=Streptomyces sp. NPDC091383 TaxID=3365996 RepID=UPI0037F26198